MDIKNWKSEFREDFTAPQWLSDDPNEVPVEIGRVIDNFCVEDYESFIDQLLQESIREKEEEFLKHSDKAYRYLEGGETLLAMELLYNCILKYSPPQQERKETT